MIMYKVPTELISADELKKIQGSEGTYFAPIEDADGNTVVSIDEWESKEFDHWKEQNKDITSKFAKIDTELKDYSYLEQNNHGNI